MIFENYFYRKEIIKYQIALEEKDRHIEYYKNQLILAERKLEEKIDAAGYTENEIVKKLYSAIDNLVDEVEKYKNKYKEECQRRLELLETISNNKEALK